MPLIICGDPREGPASYTRLVLPFGFAPEIVESSETPPCWYEPVDVGKADNAPFWGGLAWRRAYFTPETGRVLYDHASWLHLVSRRNKGDPEPVELGPIDLPVWRGDGGNTKSVCVNILPPRLILFEMPVDPAVRVREEPDPLQTGFLVLDLWFGPSQDVFLADFLHISERLRYWQRPYREHWDAPSGGSGWTSYQEIVQPLLTALADTLHAKWQAPVTPEEAYVGRWALLLHQPILDPASKRWIRLFPENWDHQRPDGLIQPLSIPSVDIHSPEMPQEAHRWAIYADNRTFVWTCAMLHGGVRALAPTDGPSDSAPIESGWWLRLLNVDRPPAQPCCCPAPSRFEADWIKDRTYDRWAEAGTLYGFAYHAGAMAGPPVEEPPLWQHFSTFYFDQLLLLLYLRVVSFRFSEKLHWMTAGWQALERARMVPARRKRAKVSQRSVIRQVRTSFETLRERFAHFTNLYQFPLISNQQQGVEMYTYAKQFLDVQDLYNEVQQEIASTHDYLGMVQDRHFANAQELLTVLATLGMVVGLAFTIVFTDLGGDLARALTEHWSLASRLGLTTDLGVLLGWLGMLIISFILALGLWRVARWLVGRITKKRWIDAFFEGR